jgi:hypothetical protein
VKFLIGLIFGLLIGYGLMTYVAASQAQQQQPPAPPPPPAP